MSQQITEQIIVSKEDMAKYRQDIGDLASFKKNLEESFSKETTQLVATILAGALALQASDVHFEPKENALLRLRLDGILHDVVFIPAEIYKKIISRIKLLAGIKLNVSDKPQDGRFSALLGQRPAVEIRASAIPTNFGESIVLRILNPKNILDIESLGLRQDMEAILNKQIKQPDGMVLVTGPTGSGKTTTLYAILQKIQDPDIKIITIEDPIEYKMEKVMQTQVEADKGYDFANGLKAVVRQDPDVILVGEIRDNDTCSIAIQAALTGHLVLSTLHTNDAPGTISRMLALKENINNISSALNLIIAQRLVRKVCPACAKMEKIPEKYFGVFKQALAVLPPDVKAPEISENTLIPFSQGCPACNSTGYKGRTGIYEMLALGDEMKNYILKESSMVDIKRFAIKNGMVEMRTDGILKILNGETTIEEVDRVIGEN